MSAVNLDQIAKGYLAEEKKIKRRIVVCAGTGCMANGAMKVVSALRAAADANHDRHRCRQAQGTRTGDDQHGDCRNQRVGKCGSRAPDGPGEIGKNGDTDDDRHENTGHRVGKLLYGRTRALGVRHHLDNLAE